MTDEERRIAIAITIALGSPLDKAYLLLHIPTCDRCRLAFQQVVDKMLDDAPRELRHVVVSALRKLLENDEVKEAQAKLREAEDRHYADPSNRPN